MRVICTPQGHVYFLIIISGLDSLYIGPSIVLFLTKLWTGYTNNVGPTCIGFDKTANGADHRYRRPKMV